MMGIKEKSQIKGTFMRAPNVEVIDNDKNTSEELPSNRVTNPAMAAPGGVRKGRIQLTKEFVNHNNTKKIQLYPVQTKSRKPKGIRTYAFWFHICEYHRRDSNPYSTKYREILSLLRLPFRHCGSIAAVFNHISNTLARKNRKLPDS